MEAESIQVPPPSRSLGRSFQQEPHKPARGHPAYYDRLHSTFSSDHKSHQRGPLPVSPHAKPCFHRGQQAAQQTETTLANVPNTFPPQSLPPTLRRRFTFTGHAQPAPRSGRRGRRRRGDECVRALPPRQPRPNDCHHHTVLGGVKKGGGGEA